MTTDTWRVTWLRRDGSPGHADFDDSDVEEDDEWEGACEEARRYASTLAQRFRYAEHNPRIRVEHIPA